MPEVCFCSISRAAWFCAGSTAAPNPSRSGQGLSAMPDISHSLEAPPLPQSAAATHDSPNVDSLDVLETAEEIAALLEAEFSCPISDVSSPSLACLQQRMVLSVWGSACGLCSQLFFQVYLDWPSRLAVLSCMPCCSCPLETESAIMCRHWCLQPVLQIASFSAGLQEVIVDPVLASDGFHYERASLETWLATCKSKGSAPSSPMTGTSLLNCLLTVDEEFNGRLLRLQQKLQQLTS